MIIKIFLLYLDPGSGSYLVQVIIAAILGALFYFKNLWWRIKAFFFKPKQQDNNTTTTTTAQQEEPGKE